MRLSLNCFSTLILALAACGDDGGSTDATETSSGPSSTGPEESSSGGSVDESSSTSGGSSSGGSTEDSGSSGVDSGSSGDSSGSSGGSSESGGTGFACGEDLDCDLATQYCQEYLSDVGGEPNSYQCQPLPDGCGGVSSCECLVDVMCGDLCEMTPDGGSMLTCPGG